MLTIRSYRRKDLDALWSIDQQCFPRGISYTRRELNRFIRSSSALTLVGETHQQIVAFIVAQWEAVPGETSAIGKIITIDVLPTGRRAGIGQRLMKMAEEKLREQGCAQISLEVAVDNLPALNFYQKLGYLPLAKLPRYYLGKTDGVLLGKALR